MSDNKIGYDFADAECGIIGIECFIIAIMVGITKGSFKWGLAAFAIMVILYVIPFIGGVVSVILSFAEMMIICDLLKKIAPEPVVLFVALFAFLILLEMHRQYVSISNEELFGFSLVITESLFASLVVWLELESIPLACAVFIVLMIFIFLPKLRGFGFVGLAIATAAYTFVLFYEHLAIQYSIVASVVVLAYVSYHHYKAYLLFNYNTTWDEKFQDNTECINDDENSYEQSSYYLSTHIDYKNLLSDSGKYGEYLIYKNLKQYEQLGAKFLFNCYLNKEDDSTTEIDVMLICQGGIFVFESKNYSGWIFGNGKSKNWTQTLPVGKGQSKKISFYNPVKQNNTHIKYLKKLIGDDIPVYSVIVFSDKCSLMNVKVSTKSARVIQCKEVKSMVDSLGGQTKHKLDIRQIYELYSRLYPFTQVNSEIKERHIGDVEKIKGRQKEENNNSQSVSLLCPRCGAPLEIKMSMRGKTIGEKFYSCSTFPVCKYSRSIEINEKEWKKE